MNILKADHIIDFHSRHWIRHGRANINNKLIVRECFDKIEFHNDRGRAELVEIPQPVRPPKLAINNGVLCFYNSGEDPFSGFGDERREILIRADGNEGGLYGKPLEWYMDLAIEYNLNFVRVSATQNKAILRKYLDFMTEHNVVVELTLRQTGNPHMGDPEDTVNFILFQGYLNVILEPQNELYSQSDVDYTAHMINYIEDRGLISSAGAYGSGGKPWSEILDPVTKRNRMISIHRSYQDKADCENTVDPYAGSGKPMSWNEPHHISAQHFYNCVKWFYAVGVRCFCYYGKRSHDLFPDLADDVSLWRKYPEKAQQLREELNP